MLNSCVGVLDFAYASTHDAMARPGHPGDLSSFCGAAFWRAGSIEWFQAVMASERVSSSLSPQIDTMPSLLSRSSTDDTSAPCLHTEFQDTLGT